MIKWLRNRLQRSKPLSDIEQLALMVAMADRLQQRLSEIQPEPLHQMVERVIRQPCPSPPVAPSD